MKINYKDKLRMQQCKMHKIPRKGYARITLFPPKSTNANGQFSKL